MGTKSEHQLNRTQRIKQSQGRLSLTVSQQLKKKIKQTTQTGPWAYTSCRHACAYKINGCRTLKRWACIIRMKIIEIQSYLNNHFVSLSWNADRTLAVLRVSESVLVLSGFCCVLQYKLDFFPPKPKGSHEFLDSQNMSS